MNHAGVAISDHAVERLRQRAGALHLTSRVVRSALRDRVRYAVRRHEEQKHCIPGQVRVEVMLFGIVVYAILSRDNTGWTGGGWAIVTVLSAEQIARMDARHGR